MGLYITNTLLRRRASHGTQIAAFIVRRDGGGGNGTTRGYTARAGSSASSPSLSTWRRKKEMGKEGLFVVNEMKRLQKSSTGSRMECFMKFQVSRLVRTDLLAVLFELQRQDLVLLSMKIYEVVRREIWYRPDMFFYRDMLMMLARNKRVVETRQVWGDLKQEQVLVDQHTYGDLVRAFLHGGLPDVAMEFYREMRLSPDPPLFLPFRVILKGLIPYPELRDKVKDDFLELFPHLAVYDPPEGEEEDEEGWNIDGTLGIKLEFSKINDANDSMLK